jgi:hypothetical protein
MATDFGFVSDLLGLTANRDAELKAQQDALQRQLLSAANQTNLQDTQASQAAAQAFAQKPVKANAPAFLSNTSFSQQGRPFSINDFLGL